MAQKPSIPKGTRDLLPRDVHRRNYIFHTIQRAFRLHGFEPIETPSFELSSTLMGKYGEEGDRLIFRILNSGEKMRKADVQALEEGNLPRFAHSLAEKALRYDLTVPFARFVVQHQHELSFPFKRYQIQPVWRADRPQKGRYQEFYQCDADVVGSDSLLHEVDFMLLFDEVLSELQLPSFTICINNRKILSGIAEVCGISEGIIDFTVALDKLDKIGKDGVLNELSQRGFSPEQKEMILPLLELSGSNDYKLSLLEGFLKNSEIGLKGISEVRYILDALPGIRETKATITFDVTLARGLNYYTGAIFEVKADDVAIGSICGGGRYDDLTGLFGMTGLSGVGISFGADRLYDVLNELDLFPDLANEGTQLLMLNFGTDGDLNALRLVEALRSKGLSAEYYPSPVKMQKQMKYANERGYRLVLFLGEEERKNGQVTVKDMVTGEQNILSQGDVVNHCLTLLKN